MTGVWPPPVIYGELLPLFDSNRGADSSPRDTYGLGGPPALREPCRPKAAGGLELVGPPLTPPHFGIEFHWKWMSRELGDLRSPSFMRRFAKRD